MPALTESALVDRLVLHENDGGVLPTLPLGWPFALSRWPVAAQWDRPPTRAQRAITLLRMERVSLARFDEGEDEAVRYARVLAPLGLAWNETMACYQIVCDALGDVKCPSMARDLALGREPAGEGEGG